MIFGKKNRQPDCINYEGPADVLVWKHDCEDFRANMQMVVHESQDAFFIKNGTAFGPLAPGEHTLDKVSFLESLFGGRTSFRSEVYYVNKAVSMGLQWGTNTPIEMPDPEYHLPVTVTAYGDYSIRVKDSRVLLVKLVGTTRNFTQETIAAYFDSILEQNLGSCIVRTLTEQKTDLLLAAAHKAELAEQIRQTMLPVFERFGLTMEHFSMPGLRISGLEEIQKMKKERVLNRLSAEDDGETELRLAQTRAQVKRLDLESRAEELRLMGSAKNQVRLEEGSVDAEINRLKGITEAEKQGFELEKLRVTSAPSLSQETPKDDFETRMKKLKLLKAEGMISDVQYQTKLQEILDSI